MNRLTQNFTNILRHEKVKQAENAGLSLNSTELDLDLGHFEDFLKLWKVFAVFTQSFERACEMVCVCAGHDSGAAPGTGDAVGCALDSLSFSSTEVESCPASTRSWLPRT